MLALLFIVACCLLHLSSPAPLTCEELLRPLADLRPGNLTGAWALAANSVSQPGSGGSLDSMAVYFSNTSDTSVRYNQGNRLRGLCFHLTYDFPMKSGVVNRMLDGGYNLTGSFLRTSCQDCLVLHWLMEREGKVEHDFNLFSRRREVAQEELEVFRAQAECLSLPPMVTMDPTQELCPEKDDDTDKPLVLKIDRNED